MEQARQEIWGDAVQKAFPEVWGWLRFDFLWFREPGRNPALGPLQAWKFSARELLRQLRSQTNEELEL